MIHWEEPAPHVGLAILDRPERRNALNAEQCDALRGHLEANHHLRAIVLAGSSGQALAFGPGHVERTADAGERGVAIYSAHRDTHFAFLKNVVIGDAIDVTRQDGRTFRYRVDAT